MYKYFIKPFFDFAAAFAGLLILSPVFILVTVLLYFANQGKPFFFQLRPGLHGKIFKIIKFRTMNEKRDSQGVLLSDAIRLTTVGMFVRKTSLDEIPQLINIIKGDMSLIGPRPLLPSYLELYNDSEKLRHTVRPGITGLTAVKGRNNISWFDKMNFDIIYANKVTFLLDLQIFFMTIQKIVMSEGVNKDGFSSTDSFEEFCAKTPTRNYKV